MLTPCRLARLAALVLFIGGTAAAQAPPLTLHQALARAEVSAYPNRLARSATRAADARAAGAARGVLPSVRGELSAIRTDDPLGGFGFLLRQRAVTPSAFDPAGLNRPLARTDVGTAVIGEVPLLNLDAWAGRRAAVNAAASASAREDWTGTGVQLDVLTAYLGAMLSAERVQVLRSGEAAGEAHLRQARSALTNGIVTPSDVLLAEVRLGEITTQRRGAEYDSWLARRQLALLLGTPDDSAMVMPTAVPVLGSAASPSQFLRPGVRGDLQAAALDEAAATADARRAAFALVPRVNAFGRYEWHDPTAPVGGRPMWTIGVMASWTPFSGGAELAARREAQANAAAARTGLEAIGAAARLEGEAAARAVGVAMQAVESTRRGAVQAAEAHRIVARKYEGGLASVAELLDAQATALGADLSAARARHDHLVALATLLRARGTDLSSLATAIDAAAATPE